MLFVSQTDICWLRLLEQCLCMLPSSDWYPFQPRSGTSGRRGDLRVEWSVAGGIAELYVRLPEPGRLDLQKSDKGSAYAAEAMARCRGTLG